MYKLKTSNKIYICKICNDICISKGGLISHQLKSKRHKKFDLL